MNTSHDMTTGSPAKHMTRFAWPILLSFLFQQLYNFADGFVVGRFVSLEALAAVGATGFYSWIILSVILGFTQGFGVLFGQRFGAKDHDGLRRATQAGVYLVLALGLLMMLAGGLLARPLLIAIQTPAALMTDALTYLYWILGGTAVVAMYNLCASVLRAMGNSKTPFYAMVIASVVNIVLDIGFVTVFRMGVAGVAMATVIAQVVSLLYCLWPLRSLLLERGAKPDRETTKTLLFLGAPIAFRNAVIAIGGLFVQGAVNQYGTALIAGITTAKRYFNFMEMAGSALEGAVATYVSQNVGSSDKERIGQGMRFARRAGLLSSLLVIIVIFVFAKPLIGLIVGSDAQTLATGASALRAMALCIPALYMLCMYRAAIQAMGNTLIPMLSGFVELGMRIVCVTLGVRLLGMPSLYFTDGLGWVAAMLLVIVAYTHIYRQLCISSCKSCVIP